jgi:hypothetical protein
MSNRVEILQRLINFSIPLASISKELSQLPWDYDDSLVTLEHEHVTKVLKRFLANELTAQDVENWSNLIESREDLAYEPTCQAQLEESIFKLANPELEGELTTDVAREIIENGN